MELDILDTCIWIHIGYIIYIGYMDFSLLINSKTKIMSQSLGRSDG